MVIFLLVASTRACRFHFFARKRLTRRRDGGLRWPRARACAYWCENAPGDLTILLSAFAFTDPGNPGRQGGGANFRRPGAPCGGGNVQRLGQTRRGRAAPMNVQPPHPSIEDRLSKPSKPTPPGPIVPLHGNFAVPRPRSARCARRWASLRFPDLSSAENRCFGRDMESRQPTLAERTAQPWPRECPRARDV